MADLIVKSKVADLIRSKNMMMASDSYDELNNVVEGLVNKACNRCMSSGRKTVKPYDF